MGHAHLAFLRLAFLLTALFSVATRADPVQYCKSSPASLLELTVDFCMGTHMYHNVSTNDYDMYLTMTVHRHAGRSTGWTAIGTGPSMQGSLMFIVYGDPLGKQDPIVSIRTANGHEQPKLLTQFDMPLGMDLRVIRSSWLRVEASESFTAWVSLVCYSCRLWPGSSVSADEISQPWIWAWNPTQDFDVYAFDAHLQMHKHHAGTGGWGTFYTDMKRTISTAQFPPSLPPIRPGIATLGSSDSPMSVSSSLANLSTANSYLHGIIMTTCFTLLFPVGIVAIRSGSARSFTLHWALQLVASVCLVLGLILGLTKPGGHKISTTHQYIGIGVASSLGLQGLLGWWHHRRFLRLQRRTWVSHAHLWIGRCIMIFGWANIVIGLLLRGYSRNDKTVVSATALVCLEGFCLAAWLWWTGRRRAKSYEALNKKPTWADALNTGETFTLSTSDDEDDEEDDEDVTVRGAEKERN